MSALVEFETTRGRKVYINPALVLALEPLGMTETLIAGPGPSDRPSPYVVAGGIEAVASKLGFKFPSEARAR